MKQQTVFLEEALGEIGENDGYSAALLADAIYYQANVREGSRVFADPNGRLAEYFALLDDAEKNDTNEVPKVDNFVIVIPS